MKSHLKNIFQGDGRTEEDRKQLFKLIELFATLPSPPDPFGLYPNYAQYKELLLSSLESSNFETIEEAFFLLYCHVHGHEAPYTKDERMRVKETGGYWCHAGGISPLLKARPWICSTTHSCDLGAGNGLQGLLLQKLYPHALTTQVEISHRMVDNGKQLQSWLKIPKDRVEWVVSDVLDFRLKETNFIYLYRPVKPEGVGLKFYQQLVGDLSTHKGDVIIFSIADCLKDFLPADVEILYDDGHLTCFRHHRD